MDILVRRFVSARARARCIAAELCHTHDGIYDTLVRVRARRTSQPAEGRARMRTHDIWRHKFHAHARAHQRAQELCLTAHQWLNMRIARSCRCEQRPRARNSQQESAIGSALLLVAPSMHTRTRIACGGAATAVRRSRTCVCSRFFLPLSMDRATIVSRCVHVQICV